jgi:hypothetical protein
MNKQYFERSYKNFMSDDDITHIGVYVSMPDLPDHETIINSRKNFEKKLKYYLKAYNDDMQLNTFNEIKIEYLSGYSKTQDDWIDSFDYQE